jgi:predicted dehydrogenase
MKKYNWAILGCGSIAEKFASDLQLLPNALLYAAAARNKDKASAFARKFGFEKGYGSYEDMLADEQVDIVYIATPHTFHHQHTLLCLSHKKAVLCEKPFAMNEHEVTEMIACAKKNNIFLMEAFWTFFLPSFQKALEIVRSGKLGALQNVKSDFAFKADFNPNNRFFDINLGGGSLMDIGIYTVFVTLAALGKPSKVKTLPVFGPTGVEESITIIFSYDNGQTASLYSSIKAHSSSQTEYCCELGSVRLNKLSFFPATASLCKAGWEEETDIAMPEMQGFGYHYEAAHLMDCLDRSLIESDRLPLSFSMDLIETLDAIRKDAGIVFPNHDHRFINQTI